MHREKVLRAEIIASLNAVDKHLSYRSFRGFNELMTAMFPDSAVAKSLQLGSTKVAYAVTFGLAPYFLKNLQSKLSKCGFYVACFDEAFNRIAHKGQMDLVIRFWDEETNQVCNRYLGSVFLGHATAADIGKSSKMRYLVCNLQR